MLQKFQVFRLIIPIFKLLSLGGKRGNSFNFGQSIRSSSIKQGNKHPSSAATPASNQSSNATGLELFQNRRYSQRAKVKAPGNQNVPPPITRDDSIQFRNVGQPASISQGIPQALILGCNI
ncbi:hypothetical protein M5K25_018340 [Dendrobium thyrsiflorum]|uniref:Uncharacterized protein n=1 Tax=Dendrobium thyrsiflorum TaxID=117978 RepID=A0ABD0UHN5_DENTH